MCTPVNLTLLSETATDVVVIVEVFRVYFEGDVWSPVINHLMKETKSKDFQSVIRLPVGCGEQNMALLMPNVYLAIYLRGLGNQVFDKRREKVLRHNMQTGPFVVFTSHVLISKIFVHRL